MPATHRVWAASARYACIRFRIGFNRPDGKFCSMKHKVRKLPRAFWPALTQAARPDTRSWVASRPQRGLGAGFSARRCSLLRCARNDVESGPFCFRQIAINPQSTIGTVINLRPRLLPKRRLREREYGRFPKVDGEICSAYDAGGPVLLQWDE